MAKNDSSFYTNTVYQGSIKKELYNRQGEEVKSHALMDNLALERMITADPLTLIRSARAKLFFLCDKFVEEQFAEKVNEKNGLRQRIRTKVLHGADTGIFKEFLARIMYAENVYNDYYDRDLSRDERINAYNEAFSLIYAVWCDLRTQEDKAGLLVKSVDESDVFLKGNE